MIQQSIYPQIGAESPEAIKAREIVQQYKTSTIVWWVYGWKNEGWKLIGGSDDREKIKSMRKHYESKGRRVQIYGCNVQKHFSKIVYETPEMKV